MTHELSTKFERVCTILDKHERNPYQLIPILKEIQDAYSYLPEDIMTYVATALGISPGAVFGTSTFYSYFTFEPKGKYVIKVCDGTACHVKKSWEIIRTLAQELGLSEKKRTTDDMMFTLETVACIGACALAPVVVVNDDVYGAMTKEKTIDLINRIREEEKING